MPSQPTSTSAFSVSPVCSLTSTASSVCEIGAMDVVHRRAIAARGLITERRLIKQSPGAQIAIVVGLGFDADGTHGGFEPKLAEHDRGIAGDLNAGADLVQHFC